MREMKDPEERKAEIIETAFRLFQENGYAETSVSRIVREIGVAQGTFYYHFKSKREVLYEILYRRFINEMINKVEPIVSMDLPAMEKLKLVAEKELEVSLERLPGIQKMKNADLFRRIFSETVRRYVPLLVGVIQQGNDEGVFHVEYPKQVCSMFHVSNFFFFHPGIFQWSDEELRQNISAAVSLMEAGYGAEKGSLEFYADILYRLRANLVKE